jgi:hypothetical protein
MLTLEDRARAMSMVTQVYNGHARREPYDDEWYTPPDLVKSLGSFDLDPCAGPMRHAKRNLRRKGLSAAWRGRVWLNPPYSTVHLWQPQRRSSARLRTAGDSDADRKSQIEN